MSTVPYNAQNGTLSNKSYAPAQGVSTDLRSRYFDPALFLQRDYQSTAEVVACLVGTNIRMGGYSIFINVGGTLNPDGTFTGGTSTEYWFVTPYADGNLVAKATNTYSLPIASALVLGGFKVGNNLSINAGTGVLDATNTSYSLPIASASVLGGIKVGANLSIDGSGILSATASSTWFSSVNVKSSPFNATGNGSTDDYAAIQAAINFAISNGIRNVLFPKGTYKITQPLILISGGATPDTGFVTVNLIGESTWWQAVGGSAIVCTFNDSFAIGIQKGKGCEILNLKLVGTFSSPSTSPAHTFYNLAESAFVTDGSIDYPTAVYAGVGIDPFTTSGYPTHEYPTLHAYYNLGGSTSSGSTGILISNCFIDKFVAGVANSINGQLKNAELTTITNVYFGDFGLKWCVIGAQAQEKVNIIYDCASWGATYGFFTNRGYGVNSTEAGNWFISKNNVAGAMIQCFNVETDGWFPTFVDGFYAESIGKIGQFASEAGGISNSIFDFVNPSDIGFQNVLNCDKATCSFTNCTIRQSYGEFGRPIPMSVQGIFTACQFSGLPFVNTGTTLKPIYINCISGDGSMRFGQTGQVSTFKTLNNIGYIPKWGNVVFNNSFTYVDVLEKLTIADVNTCLQPFVSIDALKSLTVASHAFSFTTTYPNQYYIGGLVELQNSGSVPQGWAEVTGISGTTITCGKASNLIATGNYYVIAVYPNLFSGTFVGDFAGGNTITNVQLDWGLNKASLVGQIFYEPKFSTTLYLKIVSYNSGTNVFTFEPFNVTVNDAVGIYFSNGTRKSYETNIDGAPSAPPTDRPALQKGTTWFDFKNSDKERTYKILTSGYGTGLPLATWVETTGY
jgi:hypothetical protein